MYVVKKVRNFFKQLCAVLRIRNREDPELFFADPVFFVLYPVTAKRTKANNRVHLFRSGKAFMRFPFSF